MLVTSTQVVNSINILCTNFSYESAFFAKMLLEKSCAKREKGAGKMLVKSQTSGEWTGLATGTSLYKKHVLKNWLFMSY